MTSSKLSASMHHTESIITFSSPHLMSDVLGDSPKTLQMILHNPPHSSYSLHLSSNYPFTIVLRIYHHSLKVIYFISIEPTPLLVPTPPSGTMEHTLAHFTKENFFSFPKLPHKKSLCNFSIHSMPTGMEIEK